MDQANASRINATLDALIHGCGSTWKELLVAHSVHELGQNALCDIADHTLVSARVGVDLDMEPIPIGHLKEFNNTYPAFLFEIFHGKLVQIWNTCLDELFSTLLDLHISGARIFAELGKKHIALDFECERPTSDQIREGISNAFKFFKYTERQKVINSALNPKNERETDQFCVRKNVLVRNSIQHRKGKVDIYLLTESGRKTVEIHDDKGYLEPLGNGDDIRLSFPEIHAFKSSLVWLAQTWRTT